MNDKQFNSIDKKLDVLIGLLTMSITQNKTLQDQCMLLSSLGLTQGDIAKALGKTPNNIKNALHEARKKQK